MPNLFGDLYWNTYNYNRSECGLTHEQMVKLIGSIVCEQQMEEFRIRYQMDTPKAKGEA